MGREPVRSPSPEALVQRARFHCIPASLSLPLSGGLLSCLRFGRAFRALGNDEGKGPESSCFPITGVKSTQVSKFLQKYCADIDGLLRGRRVDIQTGRGLVHDSQCVQKLRGAGGGEAATMQFAQHVAEAGRRSKAVVAHEVAQRPLDLYAHLDDRRERKFTSELLYSR